MGVTKRDTSPANYANHLADPLKMVLIFYLIDFMILFLL